MGKNMLIRAKNSEFGAREGKNQAFGVRNPKNGAGVDDGVIFLLNL